MARLYTCGFEMQSIWEFSLVNDTGSTVSFDTTIKRSGLASLQVTTSGTHGFLEHLFRASATSKVFATFWIYIATAPDADTTISGFSQTSGGNGPNLILTTSRTLKLGYWNGSQNYIGSASSAIPLNEWHMVEMTYDDASANNTETCRLDGSEFATGNGIDLGGIAYFQLGIIDSCVSDVYFDDVALNDGSGSQQNSYPGNCKVVLAKPSAAGDFAADAGTYSCINEIPPTDTATTGSTMIELDTTTSKADYNVTDTATLGIASGDTINVVEVLARVREETSGTSNYTLRIKSAAGGTTTSSSSVDAGNTTPRTNPSGTTAFGLKLISHLDPTTGVAWTPTGTNSIENMQIGAATTDGSPDTWVLWLGAMVDYTVAVAAGYQPRMGFVHFNDPGII